MVDCGKSRVIIHRRLDAGHVRFRFGVEVQRRELFQLASLTAFVHQVAIIGVGLDNDTAYNMGVRVGIGEEDEFAGLDIIAGDGARVKVGRAVSGEGAKLGVEDLSDSFTYVVHASDAGADWGRGCLSGVRKEDIAFSIVGHVIAFM